ERSAKANAAFLQEGSQGRRGPAHRRSEPEADPRGRLASPALDGAEEVRELAVDRDIQAAEDQPDRKLGTQTAHQLILLVLDRQGGLRNSVKALVVPIHAELRAEARLEGPFPDAEGRPVHGALGAP